MDAIRDGLSWPGDLSYTVANHLKVRENLICGADDFVAIGGFGTTRREWLARFLDLESGIRSHERTVCIGNSMSPFRKTNAAFAKVTRMRTSASSAGPR